MYVQGKTYKPYYHIVCGHLKIRCLEFSVSDRRPTNRPVQDFGNRLEIKKLDQPCPDCKPFYRQCPASGEYYKVEPNP